MENKNIKYNIEDFTAVYRQNKSQLLCKTKPADRTVKTKFQLNPVVAVSKNVTEVDRDKISERVTKFDAVQQVVRDSLNAYKGSELPVVKKSNRLFLSECDFDDGDNENNGTSVEDVQWFGGEVKSKRTQTQKVSKRGKQGLERFRKVVEFIILTRQIFPCKRTVALNNRDSILFFTDTKDGVEKTESDKPTFDVSAFRSLGQKAMTGAVRQHLLIPSSERTETQINHGQKFTGFQCWTYLWLIHMLRNFNKFSSYPHMVQQNLCKQGWYAKFESRRVIVKEGSRADFYYMILSGVAIYRDIETSCEDFDGFPVPRNTSVASFLRPGDTLGEKEILTNQERPATVVCKEPVEVLGVDRETLLDIFKAAGGLSSIEYLKTIPELTDFPLELLQTYHFSMAVHHYRRGAVIVKNSNESEWIYIVKSGSCQVYKAMRGDGRSDRKVAITRQRRSNSKEGLVSLPRIGNGNCGDLKSSSTDDIGVLFVNKRRQKKPVTLERSETSFPVLSLGKMPLVQTTHHDSLKRRIPKPPEYFRCNSKESLTLRKQHLKSSKRNHINSISGQNDKFSKSQTLYSNTPDCFKATKFGSLQSDSSESLGHPTSKKGSFSSEAESLGSIREEKILNKSGSQESLMSNGARESLFYVRLQIIYDKGVFGLHPLVYENMPNLSLVSNGAECVLISKQFLQDHLDKTTAHRLRIKMPMYPNLGELQTALDDQVAWDSYRGKVIHNILK